MKKKITIFCMMIAMTVSTMMPCYAAVNEPAVVETANSEITNEGAQITPFDNRHYIKVVRGAWSAKKKMTVTKAQAKTEATYRNAIIALTGVAIGVGTNAGAGIAGFMLSQFYTSPTSAAGTYYIKKRSIKKYSVDRLTGKMALLESKTEFNITHGKKVRSIVL